MSERMRNRPEDEMTLEEGLKAVLTHRPDPAFVQGLEQRLLAKADAPEAGAAEGRDSLLGRLRDLLAKMAPATPRFRWAAIPLAVLAILLIGLLIVGPQRAWAGLQAWLGYVPGVGFVDLDESRLLANPETVTRDGVTLRVEQVVAGPEETVVVIRSEGLPPEEQLRPDGQPFSEELQAQLRLQDGEVLSPRGWTAQIGDASLSFPALPPDVYRITLELSRLPLVPAGAAPEHWTVPLVLQPAPGEQVAEMYPQPYRPPGASDTHQGITLSVLEVAHHPQETAVQLQLTWENPEWRNYVGPGGIMLPYLQDGDGNRYRDIPGSASGSQAGREARPAVSGAPTPPPNRWVGSETFEPVSPQAEELTVVVVGFDFDVPAGGGFTVDLGEDPQIGDKWELDVILDVAGFPVHITGAELIEEEMRLRDRSLSRTVLQFSVDPVPRQDDRTLIGFALEAPEAGFSGSTGGYTPSTNTIRVGLTLDEGASLPGGSLDVHLRSASVLFKGPWTITWEVPDAGAAAQDGSDLPQTYAPRDASATQAGVTLSVLAAAHNTEETALRLQVHWNEPGRDSFLGFWREQPLLRDDQGNHYGQVTGIEMSGPPQVSEIDPQATDPPGGYAEERTLHFEPVVAQAERLTLEIPALRFTQRTNETVQIDLGVEPQIGQTWPLDVMWTIAGHPVHVRSVRLERGEAADLPYRLVLEMAVEQSGEGTILEGILLNPEGWHEYVVSGNAVREGTLATVLDVPAIPDGPFSVSADEASIVIQGPWEATWEVPR